MITSGSLPVIAGWCFLAIILCVPLASLIMLRREQKRLAEGPYRKPIAALYFAEIWLWLIAACVEGFVLVSFLGFYIFLNAHGRATGGEGVRPAALIVIFGSEAALVLAGWLLHRFMKHLMT
jgi:hypothetical protein